PSRLVGEDTSCQLCIGMVEKADGFAIANWLGGLRILIDASAYLIRQIINRLWSAVIDGELMQAETIPNEFAEGTLPCVHAGWRARLSGISNHGHPPRRSAAKDHAPLHRGEFLSFINDHVTISPRVVGASPLRSGAMVHRLLTTRQGLRVDHIMR